MPCGEGNYGKSLAPAVDDRPMGRSIGHLGLEAHCLWTLEMDFVGFSFLISQNRLASLK